MKKSLIWTFLISIFGMAFIFVQARLSEMPGGSIDLAKVESDFDLFAKVLDRHLADFKVYPESLQRLVIQGYMDRIPLDPEGRKYLYWSDGEKYKISYLGADGELGGSGRDSDYERSGNQGVRVLGAPREAQPLRL